MDRKTVTIIAICDIYEDGCAMIQFGKLIDGYFVSTHTIPKSDRTLTLDRVKTMPHTIYELPHLVWTK